MRPELPDRWSRNKGATTNVVFNDILVKGNHTMKVQLIVGAAISAALMSGTAVAASYQGNWPITITDAQFYNGQYCLELSGSTSGGAHLTGPLGDLYGDFQVRGRTLIAIVPLEDGGCGCNDGETFVLPARSGLLVNGSYVEDGDGEIDNSGAAKVGTKNGC